MKSITVIIPTRNREDYVKDLLIDLHAQTLKANEIIVVDQSDNPLKLSNCIYIPLRSKGPCVSRNFAAERASGDILVFLDDDSRINEDFLLEITEPIRSGNFSAVAGAICNEKGEYLKKSFNHFKINTENFIKAITNNPDTCYSKITLSFPGGCSAVLKSVFDEVQGFNESFDPSGAGEDREFALKLFTHGYAIWYNAKAKLLHIGAPIGGSIGNGSRSENLDIHTYEICKSFFSPRIVQTLKSSILRKYRNKILGNFWQIRGFRTRFNQYRRIKNQLR